MRLAILSSALALTVANPTAAQHQPHGGHAGHGAAEVPYAADWDSMMAAMHDGMAIPLSGDADVAFIKGMIPHHQGAIDMARLVLAHGADPAVTKLAEEIIAAQEAEIAWMQAWLAARGQ
jgi:uncharacterized protein (DUF305 family)